MAVATMLDSGNQVFFDGNMCCHSKSQHSYQFDEIWSNNEGTASVFLILRWRQTPCWILATRRFLVAYICSYSKSQHSYQIWWKLVKQWRKSISFVKFKMAAAAMLDSDNQVFFDAMNELHSKSQKSYQIWWKLVEIVRTSSVSAKRTQRPSHFYR